MDFREKEMLSLVRGLIAKEVPTYLMDFIDNLVPLALGSSRYLHPIIDSLFASDAERCYKLYNESAYKTALDMLYNKTAVPNEIRIHKVIGMALRDEEDGHEKTIEALIKKGYKASQLFLQNTKQRYDLEEFNEFLARRRGGTDKFTDQDLFNASVIVAYLGKSLNKTLLYSEHGGYTKLFVDQVQGKIESARAGSKYTIVDVLSEQYPRYSVTIEEVKAYWPLKEKEASLAAYVEGFQVRESRDLEKVIPAFLMETFQEASHKRIPVRHYDLMRLIMLWYNIDIQPLMDLSTISQTDIKGLLTFIKVRHEEFDYKLSDSDKDFAIAAFAVVKALSDAYLDLKKDYFSFSEEKHFEQLHDVQDQLEEKDARIAELERRLKETETRTATRISELGTQVSESTRKISQLETELERREDFSKEVIALREFAYRNSTKTKSVETKQEESIEASVAKIKSSKTIIIGGHPNWLNKMKSMLPDVKYYDPDSATRDFSSMSRADNIFIFAECCNHKLYRKMMANINHSSAKLAYVDDVNIDRAVRFMANQIKG